VGVTGASGSAVSIGSGQGHTCTLTDEREVACWGWNRFGQLGDGSRVDRPQADEVSDVSGAIAVAAGGSHTCALIRPGAAGASVACWGANDYGQVGDGSAEDRSTPVPVAGVGTDVVAVGTGARHTCAAGWHGFVECWGANGNGQVGNGVIGGRSAVSRVPGLAEVTVLDAGAFHNCALAREGLLCWGANDYGQLGDGTAHDRALPTAVGGLPEGVRAVTAGGTHSCALTTVGDVLCWGANDAGQLGDGTLVDHRTPAPVEGLSDVIAVDAGSRHTCAVTGNGDVLCWGANDWGQLGDGTTIARPVARRVAGLSGTARALGAGDEHTCAALSSGAVECWGFNYFGQLGDGLAPLSGSPTPVAVVGFGAMSIPQQLR
jgi:alpha-tubulin suppressor-like RCC1 family protein